MDVATPQRVTLSHRLRLVIGDMWRVIGEFWAGDPLTQAAAIAFYSALSFAPIGVLSVWVLRNLSPGAEGALARQLRDVFGSQVGAVADLVILNADTGRLHLDRLGLIALVSLLIASSTAFAQLQVAINRIWHSPPKPSNDVITWLRRQVFSLGIIAAIGFQLCVTLVASSVMSFVLVHEGPIWMILNELAALFFFTLTFAGLYRFVPDFSPPWRCAFVGGVVTSVLFEAGKWALAAYLGVTDITNAYGAAGSIVLLLLWVYYSALIVLIGAAASREFVFRRGWLVTETSTPAATETTAS